MRKLSHGLVVTSLLRTRELTALRTFHVCGASVADHSYAVIGGPRRSGALQGVLVFLNRRHHVLLYYEYP